MKLSKLYGIGVGPGNLELLTLKAYKLLKEVDMIVTLRSSEDKRSLALLTIKGIINERKNKPIVVEPVFPMTKDQAKLDFYWEKAREEVLKNTKGCETVAFITLGGPSLYSTFYRFLEIFKDLVEEVEVVPGVTSFSACSSIAKAPIAEGNKIVSIVPNVKGNANAVQTIQNSDSLIFLKPKKGDSTSTANSASEGAVAAETTSLASFNSSLVTHAQLTKIIGPGIAEKVLDHLNHLQNG